MSGDRRSREPRAGELALLALAFALSCVLAGMALARFLSDGGLATLGAGVVFTLAAAASWRLAAPNGE